METENVLYPEVILKQQAQQVKVFKRKFISLKDESINIKIAKYLYDRNLTLLDLVNKLDINSPTNETN